MLTNVTPTHVSMVLCVSMELMVIHAYVQQGTLVSTARQVSWWELRWERLHLYNNILVGGGEEGVLKFGFDRNVPLQNLKVDPYKYQFFKKKWPIHNVITPVGPILCQISKITQFFPEVSSICANFHLNLGKFWKIYPFIYQISHFIKGSFIFQEADFATHVGGTSP